ncbi:MAG: hypothetical protein DBX90_09385 [Lentisphaerae bacterium]|nr:MAG: hypothetical protein DBX90_09385 [Lentisphaerota bacterium]
MKQLIDCYGYPSFSERYQRRGFEKKAFQVDAAAEGITYICFDSVTPRPIHRITVAGGITTIQWAFGDWENRAALDYSHTLNEPIEIEAEI